MAIANNAPSEENTTWCTKQAPQQANGLMRSAFVGSIRILGDGEGISIAGNEVSAGIEVGDEVEVFVNSSGGFVTILEFVLAWGEANCIVVNILFSGVVPWRQCPPAQ